MKTLIKIVIAIALVVSVVGPANAKGVTPTTFELEVVQQVNIARSTGRYCGVVYYGPAKPLKSNRKLTYSSRKHAKSMANKDYFSHTSRNGRSPFKRIRQAGYNYRAAGENIGAGQKGARAIVQSWINSPSHCKVLMSKRYRDVGIGYAYNSSSCYKRYYVADFGRKK